MKKAVLVFLSVVMLFSCGASAYSELPHSDILNTNGITLEPDGGKGATVHETAVPETILPETDVPDTMEPETDVADTAVSDTVLTETSSPETSSPETSSPETSSPETDVPDGAMPETAAPETASPETASPETAAPETATPETEPPEPAPMPQLVPSQNVDPTKPMIALTFDDGPSSYTDRLLDILGAYGAKATFFVVGSHIDYRPATVQRIVNEGHDIGGHSWNHAELTKLDRAAVAEQLAWTRDKIYEVTGKDSCIMRLPYGSYNDEVKSVGAELGIAFVNWSVDTLDWKTKNADAVYDKITSSAYDGAVILCHDIHKTTVDAMENVIPRLIEDGYQLVTFSEMMATVTDHLEGGRVYNRR